MRTFPSESFLGDLEFLINTDSGSADIEGNLQVASFLRNALKRRVLKPPCTESERSGIRL